MRERDVKRVLVSLGFVREEGDGYSPRITYRLHGVTVRMSSQAVQVVGDGASVVMDVGDVRQIYRDGRMLRFVVRGGHHSFLI